MIALLTPIQADLQTLHVLVLLAASFAGSTISAAFGLGGSIAILAIMASILPPAAVIPVHGLVQLGSNAGRAGLLWRSIHWPMVLPFGAGALAGSLMGGLLALETSASVLRGALGVFILWSLWAKPPALLVRYTAIGGVVSAFLGMFVGATGPFVALLVKAQGIGRHAVVATHAGLMVLQHALKIWTFGALGFAFAAWLPLIGAMIAVGFAGTWLGARLLAGQSDARFQNLLNWVLALIAIRLIVLALI